ncbi:MAG: WYL domain-containing protein [Fibrobacteria bacterium]|nr:WYL domain-containing protein [Fibrobacteria bacterium]
MPSPLSERFTRLAVVHNLLAKARAEGAPGLDSQALQEALSCERKAVYRYMDDLRTLEAPVEYDEKAHLWSYGSTWNPPEPWLWTVDGPAGVRLALDFLLDPVLEHDLREVLILEPGLGGGRVTQTLPRLTASFDRSLLGPIATALREKRVLRFLYRKPGQEEAPVRLAHPLELFEWNGMPYLQAVDPSDRRHPYKRFALSRMEQAEALPNRFRAPARRDRPSCLGAFCGEVFTATVRAESDQAAFVRERRWHPDQKLRELRGGAVEFDLPFGDHGEAARWILGQGPGFRPVAPLPLVRSWSEMVRALHSQLR